MSITVLTQTIAGGQGRANQDAHAVQEHPLSPFLRLAVLADGQGGRHGGAEAATLACRATLNHLLATRPDALTVPSCWCELLRKTDQTVAADPDAGFTTLVAFALDADHVIGASNGDSALLLVPAEGAPIELTASQRKNPPIGSGGAAIVPFAARILRPASLLAMSDGVWKYSGWEGLSEAARAHHGQDLVAQLQKRVRPSETGPFPDDFTLILFEMQPESNP